MDIPKNLLFTKDHEWARVENNIVTIGITDFAQRELGDIIFVEFPEIGDMVDVGSSTGTIEAVKTVTDIFSPVKGKIIEINNGIDNSPEVINTDPYGDGWLMKIELTDEDCSSELMSPSEYESFVN
jgi:glycine cleavage system H protein